MAHPFQNMSFLKNSSLILLVACLCSGISSFGQSTITGKVSWHADDGKGSTQFKGQLTQSGDHVATYCAIVEVPASTGELGGISPQFTYEKVNASDAKTLRASGELGSEPVIESFVGIERGKGQASVCFKPFVLRNGEVYRVTSYSIQYRSLPAKQTSQRKSANAVASSVLASDDWYKISVQKTGLYKITPSFLSSNNITNSSVNINAIRVVGNGTGMLSEQNSVARPEDLLDVPLKIFDQNSDGVFNGSDYILFYAKGPHQWEVDASTGVFTHKTNIYRDHNYYFLSVENGAGKSVVQMPEVLAAATVQTASYDDFDFRESEVNNLVATGRQWFGEEFETGVPKSYGFSFPNMDQTEDMRVKVRALARASTASTSMDVSVGNAQLLTLNFSAVSSGEKEPYGDLETVTSSAPFTGDPAGFTLRVSYQNSSNPAATAWMDYIEVQCRSNLNYRGSPIFFRDVEAMGAGVVVEYFIASAPSSASVWKITDHNNIYELTTTATAQGLTFKDNADQLEEYVVFSGVSGVAEPTFVGAVPAQDLHAMSPPEMIIVTHPKFLSAAQRLAYFHTENDDIETKVATTTEIYNEFSSGGQDISAIRDFARYLYQKANSEGVDFKYLLLFGDASYDYKDRIANNSNYVPIWESEASLNLGDSYITDDFFGFLDDNEGGNGNIGSLSDDLLDLGVGRIPCATDAQAQAAVDKIIHYTTGASRFGDWRSKILMMADDLDYEENWEWIFVTSSERFQRLVNEEDNAFNVSKVYSDAYKQISTTGGESYPEAHDEMFRRVQQGCLVTNYIGHGGEIGLSSEKLLGLQDVNGWTNFDALSLFVTITCEFTRLDDPKRVSAGEQLALNSKGGAIALLSTTRVVIAQTAIQLNESVFENIFERDNNLPRTLGEIIMRAKNELTGDTKLKFSLIGDPAVRLAIPLYDMQVNTVNGKNVGLGDLDTLKALSKVSITGQVNDFSQQKIETFNGVMSVSVYDKPTESETLVNDGIGSPIKFELQNSLIYKGKVEVKEGNFSFEFIVPKDISFQYGNGKISLYADNSTIDAAGAYDTILVGGFNENPIEDDEGPQVQLYIDDESFVRGGITDENPELYALISDSSGINTVGNKIGHNLKAVLDNDESKAFIVNEYYEANLNSYQSGKVRYPFYDIEEGSHTLSLEVFDVHNNFSVAETDFIVANSEELALEKVLNYPNPFTTNTDFQFEHNRSDHPLEVQVQIFTVSGKLVKTINRLVVSTGNRVSSQVTWDGLDDYGDKIGKGVYVYKVKVRSQLDNSSAEKYEKLVILR